jgi:hypothetical protein
LVSVALNLFPGLIPVGSTPVRRCVDSAHGIVIRTYFADHAPPHFHALYAGEEAVIAILTLEVLRGALPDRALRMVREWASIHRDELSANWERIQRPDQPVPIAPLP